MKKLTVSMMAAVLVLGAYSCTDHHFERPKTDRELRYEAYSEAFVKEFGYVYPEQDWGFGEESNFDVNAVTRAVGTRGVNANANQWFSGEGGATPVYEVDPNILPDEKNAVFMYVNQDKGNVKVVSQPNWTNFFVTHVWKGNADVANDGSTTPVSVSYPDQNGTIITVAGGGNMDQLETQLTDGSWEHIYNFNNSNNGNTVTDCDGRYIKDKMLMVESGTKSFRYNQTQGGAYFPFEKYIVVKGSDVPGMPESCWDYYYVCFEFEKGYTETEKAKEVTNTTINGSYEKKVVTEGSEAKVATIQITMPGHYSGGATEEALINALNGEFKYVIGNAGLDIYNAYAGGSVTAVEIVTESPLVVNVTWTVPATGGESWETVTINNENFNPNGFYTAAELTAEKVLELRGETADVRNVNITVNLKGYQDGNQHFDGDNYYTDWIVRISPAIVKSGDNPGPGESNSYEIRRVYAEDLGIELTEVYECDWDFNDIVFEIRYYPTFAECTKSQVWVLAAGGILPLRLKVGYAEEDVHSLFGMTNDIMINTGWPTGLNNAAPQQAFSDFSGRLAPKDVHIIVNRGNGWEEIPSSTGNPSAKFCIPYAIQWQSERNSIRKRPDFDGFDNWVRACIPFWE